MDSLAELCREVDELQASRARLLAAANAQRRRIERELHDGLQQHLVALVVNLQLAAQLAESDRGALKQHVEEMRHDVRDALDALRRLAQEIYPPLLLDRGLAESLRAAASRASVPTRVEVTELDERYPPDVEAGVYFCCVEALQSARQPGAGSDVVVRVWREQDTLCFEVVADLAETVDVTSIGDRVGALGGSLTLDGALDNTQLRGTIPLA